MSFFEKLKNGMSKTRKNIAEKLITMAIKEADNFTSKSVKTSAAKIDAKGNKLTDSKTSKNLKIFEKRC